jgi:hypothetical protein
MDEFRLSGWPSLPSSFDRIGFSRALSQLSHRYLTIEDLAKVSGLTKAQSETLLDLLVEQGCVVRRPVPGVASLGFAQRVAQNVVRALGVVPQWRGRGTVRRVRIDPRL